MTEKEKVVGYTTDDGNIYCVECIHKDREIMKKIEQAITQEDSEEGVYFCAGCEKEIR
jgi:Zn ribbon nucleic-acid-binding protein